MDSYFDADFTWFYENMRNINTKSSKTVVFLIYIIKWCRFYLLVDKIDGFSLQHIFNLMLLMMDCPISLRELAVNGLKK